MSSVNRQVKYSGMAAIALTMLAAVTLLAGIAIPAQAQTFTVLYDFAGPQWLDQAIGQLARGRDGNFYGLTFSIQPELYQMTPAGAETTLWLAYNQFGSDETQCSAGFTHVEERHEVHR